MGSAERDDGGKTLERTGLRLGGVALEEEAEGCLARRVVESVGIDVLDKVRVDLAVPGRVMVGFSGSGGGGDELRAVAAAEDILGGAMSARTKMWACESHDSLLLLAQATMDDGRLIHSDELGAGCRFKRAKRITT